MSNVLSIPRYNHRIRQMFARASSGLRLSFPHSLFLTLLRFAAVLFSLSSLLFASNLGDTARQLADRIAAITGPGTIALEITNRSSLDDKSVREVRAALEAQLRMQGVQTTAADQSIGGVQVILSESLREYVWSAEITVGTDQPRVVLISLPRVLSAAQYAPALPITLKKTFLISQEQPILDAVLLVEGRAPSPVQVGSNAGSEITAGSRLIVLDPTLVAAYRQQSGHWELETSLPISHTRPFPRDLRGRLLLRRDHLFDVYLPGTICRSSAAAPLTMSCSSSDDPWPLTSPLTTEENGPNSVRAFFATSRNFFTGVLSPGIGKIPNVPSFYSAAPLPRANYTLWVIAAVDGSVHLVDGMIDQAISQPHWGSELASIRSNCGIGTQLLVDDADDPDRDHLRAFELQDRDPAAVSPALELDGPVTALWPEASLTSAVAIVKRKDTGWYETNRISVTCAN